MNDSPFQSKRIPPFALIVVLWFLLTVPAIFIRGAHYEEGATIGLARGAFDDGHWMSPYLYGMRFVERPVLISWLLGASALVTGRIDLWAARLPAVISILTGAGLIYWPVRRYASSTAAVFGAACFLVSPMMLQKIVTAEPDSIVSMLSFAALLVWWTGYEKRNTGTLRWFGIGLILSVAGLLKGPQPLGYFFLGLTPYLILRRDWGELSKLAIVGVMPAAIIAAWYYLVYQPGDVQLWLSHSRLDGVPPPARYVWGVIRVCGFIAIESLPAILALPAALGMSRRDGEKNAELTTLLLLYAGGCTAVLVLWPGANGRYAMPGFVGLAACAGLTFDAFRRLHPLLFRSSVAIAICLAVAGVAVSCVAMPLNPDRFREKEVEGRQIAAVIGKDFRAVYVTPEAMNRNLLLYVRSPVRIVPLGHILDAQPPFWALLLPQQEQTYRVARTDVSVMARVQLPSVDGRLVEVQQR